MSQNETQLNSTSSTLCLIEWQDDVYKYTKLKPDGEQRNKIHVTLLFKPELSKTKLS